MIANMVIAVFVGSWGVGVALSFLIKRRIKRLYPDLHQRLYPSRVTENSIAQSRVFQRFSLNPSQWRCIDDRKLLLLLKLHLAAFVVMAFILVTFLAVVAAGLFYYAFTGNK